MDLSDTIQVLVDPEDPQVPVHAADTARRLEDRVGHDH